MTADVAQALSAGQPERTPAGEATPPPRVWPAAVLVGLYWAFYLATGWAELPMFTRFLARMAALGLLVLSFTAWWLLNRRVRVADRLLGVGAAVAGGVALVLLAHETLGVVALMLSVPWVFTAWAGWLLAARRASARTRRLGLLGAFVLSWGAFTLVRMEGLKGAGEPDLHWRWSPTPEELYLAERARQGGGGGEVAPAGSVREALRLGPGDWPGFRGPDRDGEVRGVKVATDWATSPPRPVWRHRVGPGWSSVAVVGGRLFTQEQRGEFEAVVCYDAGTGREVWAHQDRGRFWERQGGIGPRATPTFAGGRIYALGATGALNCLDASTGERKWSHDVTADPGAKVPPWGFSSSPLVVKGVVIVFAGGGGGKGLLAYRAGSGERAWSADVGQDSYGSPQPASVGGEDQVLFLSDRGLTAVDPESGAVVWEYGASERSPRSVQPRAVGKGRVLVPLGMDLGTELIEVTRGGRGWAAEQRWASMYLKPSFNDFVVYRGFVYGFDGAAFCCVDLGTGERRWRKGRYGNGQVLLLADQGVLLVVSDRGEAVLVAADPERHEELGRFQAVKGKTWNHPVIAHGRLYVRNAEEMACYELGAGAGR